ncbi:phosphatidylinositol kinase- protein kinase tor1 [Spiromyces aspiralis]|uniref:Phosphatidylinositol kinase- protein kinase tor1 n=1 Tax=Spiromyces aspiralis TaxID=68401 RepID=A0ACC1HYF5_9FUNG|nr:phosphatidylinositol kinase- protein kinase tor1 [Spiromyces aspiralis]
MHCRDPASREAGRKKFLSSRVEFLKEIYHLLREYIRVGDNDDKLAAIAISLNTHEEGMLARIAQLIYSQLASDDMLAILEAVELLGRFVDSGGKEVIRLLETVVARSFEWLGFEKASCNNRIAACLIVKNCCAKAPTYMYSYINQALLALPSLLRDSTPNIRFMANEALVAYLKMLTHREQTVVFKYCSVLYEDAKKHIHMDAPESQYGAILIIKGLIHYGGMFMRPHFVEAAESILRCRDSKDSNVCQLVITIIPILAQYDTTGFTEPLGPNNESLLHTSCIWLISLVMQEKQCPEGFESLGNLAEACENDFAGFLGATMKAVQKMLYRCQKNPSISPVPVLDLISHLARSMGPTLTKYMHDTLDLMFATGLCEPLSNALNTLNQEVSQLSMSIQDRMINAISLVLTGAPFRAGSNVLSRIERMTGSVAVSAPGTPAETRAGLLEGSQGPRMYAASRRQSSKQEIILALNILGNFGFDRENVSVFVQQHVLPFLNDADTDIRLTTIDTVRKIITDNDMYTKQGSPTTEVTNDIIQCLIAAAVTDTTDEVRVHAASTFLDNPHFDFLLAKVENIQSLMLILNDQQFRLRKIALTIIGRLTSKNPGHITASLRKVVTQLITQLEHSLDYREKDECIQLLMVVAKSAEYWIRPYIGRIFQTILSKIGDTNSVLVDQFLETIGILAYVGNEDLMPYADEILNSIYIALCDQGSYERRKAALCALARCGSFCGFAITPYYDKPRLLDLLIDMLRNEEKEEIKILVTKVIGILGAVDPHDYKQLREGGFHKEDVSAARAGEQASDNYGKKKHKDKKSKARRLRRERARMRHEIYDSSEELEAHVIGAEVGLLEEAQENKSGAAGDSKPFAGDEGDDGNSIEELGPSYGNDDYYTIVAIKSVLDILRDQTYSSLHREAVSSLLGMFVFIGPRCSDYLKPVIATLLKAIRASEIDKAGFYLANLAKLIYSTKPYIRPFLGPVLSLLSANPGSPQSYLVAVIMLIEAVAEVMGGDFSTHVPTVLPLLMVIIDDDASEGYSMTIQALHTLQVLAPILDPYLYLVMHKVLGTLNPKKYQENVIMEALTTLVIIVSNVNCHTFSSHIVQTLVQLMLFSGSNVVRHRVIDVFCTLMQQLQSSFVMFMPMVSGAIRAVGIDHHPRYDQFHNMLLSNKLLPVSIKDVRPSIHSSLLAANAAPSGTTVSPRAYLNVAILRRAWGVEQRSTKEEWFEWLRSLSIEMVAQSPSPTLRACANIVIKHPRFLSDVFNAAFVSCWVSLPERYQVELVQAMEQVAESPNVPSEVLLAILNLMEHMERDEKTIPIDIGNLYRYAINCHALAKALHYREIQWRLSGDNDAIEDLIKLNQQLDQTDSAIGALNFLQQTDHNSKNKAEWYVRLERWDEALDAYRGDQESLGSVENTIGQMRCLFHMSDWEMLMPMVQKAWNEGTNDMRIKVANIAVNMSWAIGDLDSMEKYLAVLPDHSRDKVLCRAMLAVHKGDFVAANSLIHQCRVIVERELTPQLSESYSRGYGFAVFCQLLSELEEVIAFKHMRDYPERQEVIVNTWRSRLNGVQRNVDVWQKILRMRSLVLIPTADIDTWIRFIDLARRNNQPRICLQSIQMLVREEYATFKELQANQSNSTLAPPGPGSGHQHRRYLPVKSANFPKDFTPLDFDGEEGVKEMENLLRRYCQPALIYTYLKYKWGTGQRVEAYTLLEEVKRDLSAQIGFDPCHPELFALSLEQARDSSIFNYRSNPLLTTSAGPPWSSTGTLTRKPSLANVSIIAAAGAGGDTAGGSGGSGEGPGGPTPGMPWEETPSLNLEQVHTLARFYYKSGEWLSRLQAERMRGKDADTIDPADSGIKDSNDALATEAAHSENIIADPGNGDGRSSPQELSINDQILESYRMATVLDRKWYKAWHSWALQHYESTQAYEREKRSLSRDVIEKHVVPCVHGFFKAIQLSTTNTTLQDTLRLLTVWFNYGEWDPVAQAIAMGFNDVKITTWLQVIPQIIARIHTSERTVHRLIFQLLVEVGKYHPQGILFSLNVASKSDILSRQSSAKRILQKLHDFSPTLVEQAELVGNELVRVAVIWSELWFQGLEETSFLYLVHRDFPGMMQRLKPLYDLLHKGPETSNEMAFVQQYGRELEEAWELCRKYERLPENQRNENMVFQAWEIYYVIFRRIEKTRKHMTMLDLKSASPKLLKCADFQVAIPGTYEPGKPVVRIDRFDPTLTIFPSKQRPRRLHIYGNNGKMYTFVLKGHEDIRQDERVMQLFELINTLLSRDANTARRKLAIERYPVVPLSPTSGLIGFYPNCDTLHNIIKGYRTMHNIPPELEQQLMNQFANSHSTCTILQRLEAFEYALSKTDGMELYKMMWYRSKSAEMWLERRTNYTRSLAVTSMVTYILGLGDRHPSNIMLHSRTGKIVHVDFGDCFEVCRHREKAPELFPFRLTRMLIMAMEVNSIEGSFKVTCEHTMRVLRANRDSLIAVLEAFVYDPLVSWHYLQDDRGGNQTNGAVENQGKAALGLMPHTKRFNEKVLNMLGDDANQWQMANPRAIAIVERISNKLTGHDFDPNVTLEIPAQVEKLIREATSIENLCQCFYGWCPFW